MQDHDESRRAALRNLALGASSVMALAAMPKSLVAAAAVTAKPAAGAAAAAPAPAAAPLPPLRLDDPTAKSLGYVEDSTKVLAAGNPTHQAGQKCANCAQYKGVAGAARGGCNIYAGKSVNANGWCRVYVKKPDQH